MTSNHNLDPWSQTPSVFNDPWADPADREAALPEVLLQSVPEPSVQDAFHDYYQEALCVLESAGADSARIATANVYASLAQAVALASIAEHLERAAVDAKPGRHVNRCDCGSASCQ